MITPASAYLDVVRRFVVAPNDIDAEAILSAQSDDCLSCLVAEVTAQIEEYVRPRRRLLRIAQNELVVRREERSRRVREDRVSVSAGRS
jgi:hypothetical protein